MPDLSATVAGPANISVAVASLPAASSVAVGMPISTGVAPHASTHASGGSDPVTPASIGALGAGEAIAYAIALG